MVILVNAQRIPGHLGDFRVAAVELPVPLPGVVGIALGGCIGQSGDLGGRGTSPWGFDGERAHAHMVESRATYRAREFAPDSIVGWICFAPRNVSAIVSSGQPTPTLLHEYAHLLAYPLGAPIEDEHGERWRAAMASLSQPIPDRFLIGYCALCPHRRRDHWRRRRLCPGCPCPGYAPMSAKYREAAPAATGAER